MNKQNKPTMGEFCSLVMDEVKSVLGEDVDITCKNVQKNNAVTHDAMVIEGKNSNVIPSIIMDDLYSSYLRGLVSVENVAKTIVGAYENSKDVSFDRLEGIESFETARDMIVFKLINGRLNEEYLENVPHIKLFDLAITFVCIMSFDGSSLSSMRITNEHASMWGVSVKELFAAAEENTPKILPYTLKTMSEVIKEIIDSKLGNCADEYGLLKALLAVEDTEDEGHEGCMYVLSNSYGVGGAASILCRGAADRVKEKIGQDFMILPSSIHELILIPEPENPDLSEMKNMVREVNDMEVADEDILSYDVYRAKEFMEEYEKVREGMMGECA